MQDELINKLKDLPPLVTCEQVGEVLGFTAQTIRKWARMRKIASIQFTEKQIRFHRDEVEAFLRNAIKPAKNGKK